MALTTRSSLSPTLSGSTPRPGQAGERSESSPPTKAGARNCQNDDRLLAHEEIGDWLADELTGL